MNKAATSVRASLSRSASLNSIEVKVTIRRATLLCFAGFASIGALSGACTRIDIPAVQLRPTLTAVSAPAAGTGESGVEGQVWIGPTCPVAQRETECPDLPFEATLVVTDSEGNEVARGISNEDGYFRFQLPVGDYILVPETPNPDLPPYANPVPFAVTSGAFTQLAVRYDSGIR